MSLKRDVLWLLKRYNISISKKLGQHFLVDEKIMKKVIQYLEPQKDDIVLEIGSGLGILTNLVAAHVKKVYAVEKDARMAEITRKLARDNVEVIVGDFLKIELPDFNKIIGNIPYAISSQITAKILLLKFDIAVLMYQKEFAERFKADPGTKKYGRITILVNYYADVELLDEVSPKAFYPKPEVYSRIVRFRRLKEPRVHVKSEELFFEITRILFSQRRKKVRNILRNYGIPFDEDAPYLEMRGDALSIEQIAELVNYISERKPHGGNPW
ncbi:MAG: ribosomal RNA small subunit methyltransferase A [Thermoplasmata archaeon]|nr:ribosomal RNA small subunit methyltransferase A [Euryarchaeota archaeon]RLF63495.1 MAG: ribosomal RNA small subunit methyltransferase A [Thermoplasmata archaeon]